MSAVSTLVRNGVAGWRRFPPNLFAIPFGLAGLAEAWPAAGQTLHTPEAIPDLIDVLAALAWIALLFCYAAQGARTGLADLRHKRSRRSYRLPRSPACCLLSRCRRTPLPQGRRSWWSSWLSRCSSAGS